jgi:hypothetical protein
VPSFFPALSAMLFLPYFVRLVLLSRGADCLVQIRHVFYLSKADPHSPAQFRANGAVSNVPEFYIVFDVKPTVALYLPDEERVKIW